MNYRTKIDKAIQPLLKRIWDLDIDSYQSCSGHRGAEGFPTALLWLNNEALTNGNITILIEKPGIEEVSRIWGREPFPIIEILFVGETLPLFADACESIYVALAQK